MLYFAEKRNNTLDESFTTPPAPKRSSTFGIIALVISVIAFYTPKFELSMVLIALAAFIIIGFVRDGNKIFSVIATCIGVGLIILIYDNEATQAENEAEQKLMETAQYSIRYEVSCYECEVRYTNETGGTDKIDAEFSWSKTLSIKGSEFVSLNAQNNDNSQKVGVKIYVNENLADEQESTGPYQIASANCTPKDEVAAPVK